MDDFALACYPEAFALFRQLQEAAVMSEDKLEVAYSYLRFSELGKQAKGDSMRRQTALRDGWLARNPAVRLDLSLRMKDEGVSGYSGIHRTNPRYAMFQFLEHVKSADVLPGSYLIVENLDRLTREHPRDSIRWVLDLISAGIRIVQLAPYEQVYDSEMDERTLFLLLSELARGHAESKRKATLLGPIWAEKKRLAREGVPYGKRVPAWLELADGAYRVRPGAADSIREVYRLCCEGLGGLAITKRMNRSEYFHSPAGGGVWTKGYVVRLLETRTVLGEYQPMKGSKRRVPDGEPVPNYFPAVVDEDLFYRAQRAKEARTCAGGRPSREGGPTSPFAGLLWNAADGARLQVKRLRKGASLVSARVHQGVSDRPQVSFPLNSLVDALLSQMREIAAADLFSDPGATRVDAIQGRIADVREKLRVARERFDANRGSAVWADMVSEYDRAGRHLAAELEDAKRAAQNPLSASWVDAVRLMRKSDPLRLRQCLRVTVESVWCLFHTRGCHRLAAVQVWFVGGKARRDYLILHRTRYGVDAQRNPPTVKVASPEEMLPFPYDLRERQQAKAVERVLAKLDLSRFG